MTPVEAAKALRLVISKAMLAEALEAANRSLNAENDRLREELLRRERAAIVAGKVHGVDASKLRAYLARRPAAMCKGEKRQVVEWLSVLLGMLEGGR